MKDSYVFVLGKPGFGADIVKVIHANGYKAGLFVDKTVPTARADAFDTVIELDFEHLVHELPALTHLRGSVAGLINTYENYILAKAMIGEHLHVPTLSMRAAKASTDKALMRQAFYEYDPSISPAYTAFSTENEAVDFADRYGYPVIIKPTNLVKSLLVMKASSETELRHNVRLAISQIDGLYKQYKIYEREPQLIIEQYVDGDLYSLAAYVDEAGEATFAPGATSLTSAAMKGYDDNYLYSRQLPAVIDSSLEEELFNVARKGIKALELTTSPAHVELIAGDAGVKLVEIGARTGGYRPRMYSKSYGIDLVDIEVKNATGQPNSMNHHPTGTTAVYELFPTQEGTFSAIIGPTQELIEKADYYSVKTQPGSKIGPARNGYKAALIILISTADQYELERLCSLVDELDITVSA